MDLLDPEGPPQVRLLAGDCPPRARLAVMSGSFNPPTQAHLGLAQAALATGQFDRLLLAMAVRTINKEQIVGATLEERCAMLAALVRDEPRLAVLATNRGLYVEQAQAIQASFAPSDLAVIVGFDKIVQILDPRYYADRDAAMRDLFARARFLVAPRDGGGRGEIDALFRLPENRRFAGRVQFLPISNLEEQTQRLSSTQVRALLARGEDVSWAVPAAVEPLLAQIAGYIEDRPAET
ncbi:MAG TPA: nicotinate-nicotinamide nucleotide adenylyltransferase [Chloroflexota bacterium]|nr:nicotinate-nicotinamide nucleotide adenylyltransferase [Chloroflexota bacterium]